MNKINYDKELNKLITSLKKSDKKPTLLLHCCCAPCATACIEKLRETFDITAYFYNPNMDSEEEYRLRATEQERLCKTLGIKCVIEEYDFQNFYDAVSGYEKEKEGGLRCQRCFKLRLTKTARYAKENGFDMFATTLTVSPLKNSQLINEIGARIQDEFGIKYLPSDFKKKNGYLRSIELSKEYQLYRQNYCGCIYSKNRQV